MKNTLLSKAITIALTGSSLFLCTNVSAKAMYNTYNAHSTYTATDNASNGTDGWVWGKNASFDVAEEFDHAADAFWAGTTNNKAPLNYKGSSHLNWAALLEAAGDSQEISQQNSFDTYGIYADIDSTGGSWLDQTGTSWKHNTEIGLIKSNVTQRVHININSLNGASQLGTSVYGATIYKGMDTTTGRYNHHGAWNYVNFGSVTHDNPLYILDNLVEGTGMSYLTHSTSIDTTNDLSFIAQAGEIYSVLLGGYLGEDWNRQHDGHEIFITTSSVSAVPIPAAAWLMGSGLLGLASFRRKKQSS